MVVFLAQRDKYIVEKCHLQPTGKKKTTNQPTPQKQQILGPNLANMVTQTQFNSINQNVEKTCEMKLNKAS